jgi:hypothetical protein
MDTLSPRANAESEWGIFRGRQGSPKYMAHALEGHTREFDHSGERSRATDPRVAGSN